MPDPLASLSLMAPKTFRSLDLYPIPFCNLTALDTAASPLDPVLFKDSVDPKERRASPCCLRELESLDLGALHASEEKRNFLDPSFHKAATL